MSPSPRPSETRLVVRDSIYNHPRLERLLRFLFGGFFRVFHFARFYGVQNLPPRGPCIFAPNHQSYYDPPLVAVGQPLPMHYLAWDALFVEGFIDRFLRFMGASPVDLDGANPGGYRSALEALGSGKRIMVFPEGGRSYGGQLMPFREGVARLAMKTGVPIVPVCIVGADFAWPRGEVMPQPFTRIEVHYLPPIYPRASVPPSARREEARRITGELFEAIQTCLHAHKPGR